MPATCTGRASGSADPDPGEGKSRTTIAETRQYLDGADDLLAKKGTAVDFFNRLVLHGAVTGIMCVRGLLLSCTGLADHTYWPNMDDPNEPDHHGPTRTGGYVCVAHRLVDSAA